MKELKDMTLSELWELFPIQLEPHNKVYFSDYENEKSRLLALLSDFNIYRINHIGSTAIPDLYSKPIIDILLESDDFNAEPLLKTLENDGWIIMSKNIDRGMIALNKGYTPSGFAKKVFHLHLRIPSDHDELYFKDYLLSNPDVSKKYGQLKNFLKGRFEHNRDGYTDAKSEFIMHYTKLARKEYGAKYLPIPN